MSRERENTENYWFVFPLNRVKHPKVGNQGFVTLSKNLENGGRTFSTWIKARIADYGFAEGQDYTRVELKAGFAAAQTGGELGEILYSPKNEALKTDTCDFGQQGRIEYHITLDMAKELAMVERNEKGRQARKYFIECGKRLQAGTAADTGRALNGRAAITALTNRPPTCNTPKTAGGF